MPPENDIRQALTLKEELTEVEMLISSTRHGDKNSVLAQWADDLREEIDLEEIGNIAFYTVDFE